MAASEEGPGCFLPRGRSQSDPSILTEPAGPGAGEHAGNGPALLAAPGRAGGASRSAATLQPAEKQADVRRSGHRRAAGAQRSPELAAPARGARPVAAGAPRGAPHLGCPERVGGRGSQRRREWAVCVASPWRQEAAGSQLSAFSPQEGNSHFMGRSVIFLRSVATEGGAGGTRLNYQRINGVFRLDFFSPL